MRSPVFRRPGCRRHAGTTKRRPKYATPEVVAGRHCTTRLCFTPLTHKVIHVKPRREHSPAPPPGWRKCSPPVIVSAAGGDADAARAGNVVHGTLFALWRAEWMPCGGWSEQIVEDFCAWDKNTIGLHGEAR